MSRPMIQMQHYAAELVGKTIERVRSLNETEMKMFGWYQTSNPTCVLEFADGSYAVVMQDPEGNGTGFLDIGSY